MAFLLSLGAVLLLGCSHSLQTTSSLPGGLQRQPAAVADTLGSASVSRQSASPPVPEAPPEAAGPSVSALVKMAEDAVIRSAYDSAHVYLKEALRRMQAASADPTQEAPPEDVFQQISDIYSERMPTEYLDSVPDEIAADVFHGKLSRSLDSLKTAPPDSAAIAKILCQNKVTYDMPMLWNERVLQALYFFVTGKKGPTARWLARSPYYVPFMRAMLAEAEMPRDLAYLPLIESGYNPRAYSRARAAGLWQFIPSTGRRYGLRQSFWLDERRDHYRSTAAGLAYLKELHDEFGDWYLALASYNCGEGKVRRAVERQGTADFWQLRLPPQTMAYVPEFIAALIVAKNPQCFGYAVPDTASMDLDTVHFSECLDFQTISEGIGTPVDDLRACNPHILRFCTPPDAQDFTLYLPRGSKEKFVAFAAQVPPEKKVSWYRYRILRGDNLGALADHFRMPVSALKSINNLRSNRIVAGHYLLIPIPVNAPSSSSAERTAQAPEERAFKEKGLKPVRYRPRKGESLDDIARLFRIPADDIRHWNDLPPETRVAPDAILTLYVVIDKNAAAAKAPPAPVNPPVPRGERRDHVVTSGDNLTSIAQNLGVSVDRLVEWNGLTDADPIYPGQALVYYEPPPPTPKTVTVPAAAAAVPSPRTPDLPDSLFLKYEVKEGDNLTRLARLFRVKVDDLLSLNNLPSSAVIRPGQILRIPREGIDAMEPRPDEMRVVYYQVKTGDNLWNIAREFNVPLGTLEQMNGLRQDSVLVPGDTVRILTRVAQ